MSYAEIMDQYTIEHGADWRPKFEHARLYNYLPPFTDEETFLRMAVHYSQEKDYKPRYAAVLYKELFKRWPESYDLPEPLQPSEDFLDWIDAKAQRMRISRRKKRKPKKRQNQRGFKMTLISETANLSPEELIGKLPEVCNLTPAQAKERLQLQKRAIGDRLENVKMPYSLAMFDQLKAEFPNIPNYRTNKIYKIIMYRGLKYLRSLRDGECRHCLNGDTEELTQDDRDKAAERLEEIRSEAAKRRSKRSGVEKRVIAPVETPVANQQEPAKPAGRFGRTLSLKKAS